MSQGDDTTHLKNAIFRIQRLGPRPAPPRERLTDMERITARLTMTRIAGGGRADRPQEPWDIVAGRLDFDDLATSRPRDVRRAIAEIWTDDARTAAAAPLVAHGLDAERKTYDRELVFAYLRHFPIDHPAFDALNAAASVAAERHDWPWRERGRRFHLWYAEEGPAVLGEALLAADQPHAILGEAGLDGDLAAGGFVEDALDDACEVAGDATGAEAERVGTCLIALFDALKSGGDNAMLAYGLLNPWRAATPSEAHRKAIAGVLVKRIGDPRFDINAWSSVRADLRSRMPGANFDRLIETLRRWLTHTTVRAFFAVVSRTTDRPDQWAARQSFWLALLEAGAIEDAWFALGRQAGNLAHDIADESGVAGHGEIMGAGATDCQSALIMSIGDVRIAEWSDNGSCRFWSAADPQAPKLYEKSYFGMQLRAMNGGRGFDKQFAAIPHTGGWQDHFAAFIYSGSRVRHPRHGEGYAARRSY